MSEEKLRCLAVSGATASGKTALAIALAERLGGEIISCDSMQIYRGMDIGTAKATREEQRRVPHHMIDILEPTEPFSAALYAEMAEKIALAIAQRGKVPIFCGGTGLYLEAVRTSRHERTVACDTAYRAELEEYAEKNGNEALHALLKAVDSASAEIIHKNNRKRVIRALEIYHATGVPKSVLDGMAATENPRLAICNFFLDLSDRELLYRRIDARVEKMMEEGLLEETAALLKTNRLIPGTTAYAAIGYKECIGAVLGEYPAEEAVAILKNATHHYAKRQKTWFSAKPHIRVLADEEGKMREPDAVLEEVLKHAVPFLNGETAEQIS